MPRENPINKANFFSRLIFCWMNSLFNLANKRPLKYSDLWDIPPEIDSDNLTQRMINLWDIESKKARPSFNRVIFRFALKELLQMAALLVAEVILSTFRPIVVGWILLDFRSLLGSEAIRSASINSLILFLNMLLSIFFRNHLFWVGYVVGVNLRIACTGLIFRKVLSLNQKSMSQTTTGQIINLISTDLQRFELSFMYIHYAWVGIVQSFIVLGIMIYISGLAPIACILVMIFFVSLQALVGRMLASIKLKMAMQTDNRVKIISNIIAGIKALKIYVWEKIFIQRLAEARKREMEFLMKVRYCQSFNMSQIMYQQKILTVMLFVTIIYILKEDSPTALGSYKIYTILGLLQSLFLTLTLFLPTSVTGIAEISVTSKRVQDFLQLELLGGESLPVDGKADNETISLEFSNVSATWSRNETRLPILQQISFKITGPKLLALVGNVGSGKSSLLMAALGELPFYTGHVKIVAESVAYLPQVSWIFPGTIRDNILCGQPFDRKRYLEVLRVTTLDQDCEAMPKKDRTPVGERGVSLSGGQKARLGLARVAYGRAKIVYLDDPLAAVDARVAGVIFHECIQGFMADRLRVLISHQHHFLPQMDSIIVLNSGQILNMGSYDDLLSNGIDFENICQQSQQNSPSHAASSADNDSFVENDVDRGLLEQSDADDDDEPLDTLQMTGPETDASSNARRFVRSYDADENLLHKETSLEGEKKLSLTASSINHEGDSRKSSSSAFDQEGNAEVLQHGNVAWRVYFVYLTAGGGVCSLFFCILLFILSIANSLVLDFWLSRWTMHNDELASQEKTTFWFPSREMSLLIYGLLVISLVIFSTGRTLMFFQLVTSSTRNIHNRMLQAIVNTRMTFFETNSSGRILNRVSKDVNLIDDSLGFTFLDYLQCLSVVISVILVGLISSYYVLIPLAPIIAAFYFGRKYYLTLSRDLKRIDGLARSPVFSHISSSLQGLACIRSIRGETRREAGLFKVINGHSRVLYLNIAAGRWISLRLDLLCVFYTVIVIIICLLLGAFANLPAGQLGLILSTTTILVGLFQWTVRQSAETENLMVSTERCMEYMNLPSEDQTAHDNDQCTIPRVDIDESSLAVKCEENWPHKGEIIFDQVYLRYNADAQWALNNINLHIPSRHKIGIAGRTGAGKSSLLSALFRLVEISSGKIIIDQVDIKKLDLRQLRVRLSIIPQDPIMFPGTLKQNLDPEGLYSDEKLLHALRAVELSGMLSTMSEGLDTQISEEGSNLSSGQRQLVSLARAILKGSCLLVIDEATANVDPTTDSMIQKTIRREFAHCTILTIAHRLHTIIDSDLVVFMEAGQVVEVGEPHKLLNPNDSTETDTPIEGRGKFAELVRQTGLEESKSLSEAARAAYHSTSNSTNRAYRDSQNIRFN